MELLSEQELRTKRSYRITLIFSLLAVVGLIVWFAKPPAAIDLQFLSHLKIRTNSDDYGSVDISVANTLPEVETLFDGKLKPSANWTKSSWGMGPPAVSAFGRGTPVAVPAAASRSVAYHHAGRPDVSITITTTSPKVTNISIYSSNGRVLTPPPIN